MVEPLTGLLAVGALLVVASTVPYTASAIEYRRRDNGLAFLLMVAGLAVWNAMFVAQLLTADPLVQMFFLALSVVGAILTGLGWFLFATTASGTSLVLDRSGIYAAAGILGGLDITLAIMAPVHTFYWEVGPTVTALGFAPITPAVGYWLHTAFLVALFGAGTGLFAAAWRAGTNVTYSRAYAAVGTLVIVAILGSNGLAPGGLGVASLAAVALTTIGWIQASRGRVLGRVRARFG